MSVKWNFYECLHCTISIDSLISISTLVKFASKIDGFFFSSITFAISFAFEKIRRIIFRQNSFFFLFCNLDRSKYNWVIHKNLYKDQLRSSVCYRQKDLKIFDILKTFLKFQNNSQETRDFLTYYSWYLWTLVSWLNHFGLVVWEKPSRLRLS